MAMAMGKLVETPHIKKQTMVQKSPTRIVGFRPNRSEALPHGTAVMLCASEKTELVAPAHFAISFFSTPKLAIISGR